MRGLLIFNVRLAHTKKVLHRRFNYLERSLHAAQSARNILKGGSMQALLVLYLCKDPYACIFHIIDILPFVFCCCFLLIHMTDRRLRLNVINVVKTEGKT